MKKAVSIVVLMFLVLLNVRAESVPIVFDDTKKELEGGDGKRPFILSIMGEYDNVANDISISANVAMENLSIEVKDESGAVVYSSVSAVTSRIHTFTVSDTLPDGNYVVTVTIGDLSFSGALLISSN